MKPYRVTHKKSGDHYVLLANSAAHAVEIVELRIGDAEKADAWHATEEASDRDLEKGIVYDGEGRPITPVG